jgi:hypothetical protein
MARDLDDAEERCLEAEAWADEISAWGTEHRDDPGSKDAITTARMVMAIVKSIRLSVVAGEDRDTREFLLEELDQLLEKYRSPTSSGEHLKPGADLHTLDEMGEIEDLPASVKPTMPPPPGMAPEDIWSRAPHSRRDKNR